MKQKNGILLKQITVIIVFLTMIPLIASIGITPALSFAQADVGCKGGEIRLKDPSSGEIVCMDQDRAQTFIAQGWVALDKIPSSWTKTTQATCRDGMIHLTDPNSGSSDCAKPADAKKLVNEGWIASHSPAKQHSSGVAPHDVVCRGGLKLIIRDSGHPNCMKQATQDKLIDLGVILKRAGTDCKGGEIHLKNLNTGAIVCEKQSLAKNFVSIGWVALDKIPGMETTAPTICTSGKAQLKNPNSDEIFCANQDQVQKYIDQGWVLMNTLSVKINPSDIIIGETMHTYTPTIETIDVTQESPSDSNAYYVTYRVTAGDQHLADIQITVVSDTDSASGTIDLLGARDDTTLQIRILAYDPSSITGSISNYNK